MRDQYIQMRKSGQYDLAWFYQHYLDNKDSGKYTIDFQVFNQAFNMYFQMNGAIILELMDKKMQVTKIQDNNNNLLYID